MDDIDLELIETEDTPPPEPPSPPKRQLARRNSTYTAPVQESPESERYILSCAAIDGDETIQRCIAAGLRPDAFNNSTNRAIWETFVRMFDRGDRKLDQLKVFLEIQKNGSRLTFEDISKATSHNAATTAELATYIESLRAYWAKRQILKLGEYAREQGIVTTDPSEVVEEMRARLRALSDENTVTRQAKPITAFSYPTSNDPNILLGNDDYLGRGGQLLFLSYAGAGKSSAILNAVMSWALGRAWMGIRCGAPLKTLIVQAEDSERYVGKISASFIAANDLGEPEMKLLWKNVHIVKIKGVTGDKFFAELRMLVAQYNPDLVVINPAYLYAEGDISRAEYAQPFLVGLDALNREEKFAYIVVHHTGKPTPKDNKGDRAKVEDWESIYMGFGSSYFANWPRCSMFLERRPGDGDRYILRLGKGGRNAGVTKIVDHEGVKRIEPTTSIPMRFSKQSKKIAGIERQLVYWEADEETEADKPQRGGVRNNPGGRPRSASFTDFSAVLKLVCLGQDKRQPFGVLHKAANGAFAIATSTFTGVLQRALETGELQKDASDGRYFIPKS